MYNQSFNKQKKLNETWNSHLNEKEVLEEVQLPGMSFIVSFVRSLGNISIILSKAANVTKNENLAKFAEKAKEFHNIFVEFEKENPVLMKFIIAGDIVGSVKGKGLEFVLDKIAKYLGKKDEQAIETTAGQASEQSVQEGTIYDDAVLDDGTLVCAGCLQEALESERKVIQEAKYQGRTVALNKPMKGDVKKSKVYVKNEKGNVVKVNFGDKNMTIKKNIPARRKSFRARHKCDQKKDKTSAGYWSCKAWE